MATASQSIRLNNVRTKVRQANAICGTLHFADEASAETSMFVARMLNAALIELAEMIDEAEESEK